MKIFHNAQVDRTGVQLVGEQFERNGYIFREQPISDYGIDAQIEIVENDNVTGELIAIQIKSGSSWLKEETEDGYVFRGNNEHLRYWLDHSLPVIIVLCDVDNRVCYWQAITAANIVCTKRAWKINIPKYQRINPGMDVDLKRLVKKLPVHKNYTIGSIEDNSHGAAKRYSLNIILNKEHTQAEIIEVIKTATTEAINTEYHRSEITRRHWRDQPAHVVWLTIYPTAEDEKNRNFVCQSEWFTDAISKEYLPMPRDGESIGIGIRVQWNDNYLATSRHNTKNTITKEAFILQVNELTTQTIPLVEAAIGALSALQANEIDLPAFTSSLTDKYQAINEIYTKGTDLGLAPFECKDLSVKFQSLITHAHNVYLPFSGIGDGFEFNQMIFNIKIQAEYFCEALTGFEFELQKVQ